MFRFHVTSMCLGVLTLIMFFVAPIGLTPTALAQGGHPLDLAKAQDPGDPGDTDPLPSYKQIRLHAVQTGNDDGTDLSSVTAAVVSAQVVDLNQIYAPLGIHFLFDPNTDFEMQHDTLLNKTFDVVGNLADSTDPTTTPPVDREPYTAARRALADQHRGKLVLFFARPDQLTYSTSTGTWMLTLENESSSSHNERHVSMVGNPGARWLAHEIGHYLHVTHTFPDITTVADAVDLIEAELAKGVPTAEGLGALDGDRSYVSDTPADAGVRVWDDYFGVGQRCGAQSILPLTASLPMGGTYQYQLQPARDLAMSYFTCPPVVFSPQQTQRIHDSFETLNRHDLVSRPPTSSTSLLRRGSAYAGAIADVEAVRVGPGRIVTLVRTPASTMKVIPWDVTESGTITRAGAGAYAGTVTEMAGASVGLDKIVTATRNGNGNLEVIQWRIHSDGSVERLGSMIDIPIKAVKIARFDMLNAVTAVQLPNDDLKVIAWQLNADGSILRLAEADAGQVDGFDISPSWLGVTTSVRDGSGNLKVINWHVRRYANWQIIRKGSAGGAPTEPEIAATGMDFPSHSAVSSTDAFDWLGISTWGVDYEGGVQPRTTFHTGVKCTEVVTERLGTEILAVGCRATGNSNLLMMLFDIAPGGQSVSMIDHEYTGTVTALSLARAHRDVVVSAVRNGSGDLQLIAWERSEDLLPF